MNVLSLDTSTRFLCLALHEGGRPYERDLNLGIRHSQFLMPTIKRMLKARGRLLGEMDYFACGIGPGSFTGIRVGLSTVKGFAWALKRPVVGIASLDIVARNALSRSLEFDGRQICVCIDAKRDLIYYAAYALTRGALRQAHAYALLTPEEVSLRLAKGSVVLGDALALHKERLCRKGKNIFFLDEEYWFPKAHHLGEIALERIKKNKATTVFKIKPLYLYPKECQIKPRT